MFSNWLLPHQAQNTLWKSKEASEEGGNTQHSQCTACALTPSPLGVSCFHSDLRHRQGGWGAGGTTVPSPASFVSPQPVAERCVLREEAGRGDGQGVRFRGPPLPWSEQMVPDLVRR